MTSLQPVSDVPLLRSLGRRPTVAAGGEATAAPTVATDQADYSPGQTVIVTGTGWQANSAITLTFRETLGDHGPFILATQSDGNGTIDTSRPNSPDDDFVLQPHDLGLTYELTATGPVPPTGALVSVTTTFTDNIRTDFKQCANADPTLGACHWINSILQGQNSVIYEGMSTLQRFIIDDVPESIENGNYRLQFHTDSVKGGAHAYDFITTWETAVAANAEIAPPPFTQPVPLYPVALGDQTRPLSANQIACGDEIPDQGGDPTVLDVCLALRSSTNVFVTYGSLDPANMATFDGAIIDNPSTNLAAYQARYGRQVYCGGADCPAQHRAIKIYSNAPLDSVNFLHTGYDAQGNAKWEINWHSTGVPTSVLLEFAAHVAVGESAIAGFPAVGYGLGKGAASISGSPFHVSFDLFDNGRDPGDDPDDADGNGDDVSIGSQDNQLANDILIPPAPVSIVTEPQTSGGVGVLNGVVSLGTTVHDTVTINTNSTLHDIPAGSTITFVLYQGLTCTGTIISTQTGVAVTPTGGQIGTAISQDFTATQPGGYSYLASFVSGDTSVLLDHPGDPATDCEPFTVADATISITPATATNAVGTNHTLTITVNALGVNIGAAGGTVTANIDSGPGSFVGGGTCNYTGGAASASCTVVITSAATGTTVVSATSNIPLAGNGSVLRTTSGTAGNSGPASKTWVNANIAITPATATNAVGTNHVLTITINAVGGTIDAGSHAATASIVSGPGSFVGSPTCNYTGGGASATCTVTITSAATGTTVVSATSNIPVGGQTITRTTNTAVNTAAGGSGNASKAWVNANIQITPATSTNPISTNHTLTITVNALGGTIDAGTHTATASIVSGPGSFVGSATCNYTGGGASATCTVVITSATAGTTVVSATSNIPVGGQTITRTTNTAANTAAGGSGNASKTWATARISIGTSGTNVVGTAHTFTVTVEKNVGAGFVAAAGVTVTSSATGVGSITGGTCGPTGPTNASGQCTVIVNSAVVGTTTVNASATVDVGGGVNVPVATNGAGAGTVSNVKTWVNANIQITPATGLNPIGSNHTLTITVNALGGTIGAAGGTATASIVSGPGSFVGSPTCAYTGGGASSSCLVVITSPTAGTTVVQATSNIPVGGLSITRTTNTAVNTLAGGSGNASKTWFDTRVQLTKLVNGAAPTASDPSFTFQLWAGLSATTGGSLLETKSTTSAPGGNVLLFTTSLVPGGTYQMCELVVLGYTPDFGGFGSFNPGGNAPGYLCFNFTANATSATLSITVNNLKQTGPALTIGYWKNWSSCSASKGKQSASLDITAEGGLAVGSTFTIGILTLTDTNATAGVVSYCTQLVNLLNKTSITGGKKLASDPLFNMTAQLVAYKLNLLSGSTPCAGLGEAAQALLVAHNFNGSTYNPPLSSEQAAYANALNNLLDTYNNNNGCGVLPTPPNPL